MDEILRTLGEIVLYGSGASALAYLLFKLFAKSWIENKFAERLEQFKHQQALEIQRLRAEIDSMLSGVLRIQEREFETLPHAWSLLDEAYGQVLGLTSPLQQYPDLDRITAARLDEFLAESELRESQKQEIRDSKRKLDAYREIIFWYRLHKVEMCCRELRNYNARYGIFFPKNIKQKFDDIVDKLWSAVSATVAGQEDKDLKMRRESWDKVQHEIAPLYSEIEADIHKQLRSHGTL